MNKAPQLFIWKIPFEKESELLPLMDQLSDSDREVEKKISREGRRIEFVAGRFLLRSIFKTKFDFELPSVITGENRIKPSADQAQPFNLSHTKQFVALAVNGGEHEIGLDIQSEISTRNILNLAKNYGTPAEIKFLDSLPLSQQGEAFFKIWSLKEAFAKSTGEGLSMDLQKLEFDFEKKQIVRSPSPHPTTFFYSKIDHIHCSLAVSSADAESPVITEVEYAPNNLGQTFKFRQLQDVHFEKIVFVVPSIAADN